MHSARWKVSSLPWGFFLNPFVVTTFFALATGTAYLGYRYLLSLPDWIRDNEIYVDVLEWVNLLMSNTDNSTWQIEVAGAVQIKAKLIGMPECRLVINDKVVFDQDKNEIEKSEQIDHCSFHQCVLSRSDADHAITFIPPEGEFELVRYRTPGENLPFEIVPTVLEEPSTTNVSINIKIISAFPSDLCATDVVLKIPVPDNTSNAKIHSSFGSVKYQPDQHTLVWRSSSFAGNVECIIAADVELNVKPTVPWNRPPIQVEFELQGWTASGVHVRSLRIQDKSGKEINKWIRYITKAGSYQVRM